MVTPAGLAEPVSVAEVLAVNVAVLVVALVEVNEAVTPLGNPDGAVRLTAPLKLLNGTTVTVPVEVPAWFTDVPATGVVVSPKKGIASVTKAVWVSPPLVPVIATT
jgi:hypothetical protein